MAKYLITGVAGFIGSTIADRLVARGDEVRGIDNFSTGNRKNLNGLAGKMDLQEADILDMEAMRTACKGVDCVFHEAAIPSVPKSVKDPLGSNQANVDGTVNVLIAAKERG